MARLKFGREGGTSSYLFHGQGTSVWPHHLDGASAGCTSGVPLLLHSRTETKPSGLCTQVSLDLIFFFFLLSELPLTEFTAGR